MGVVVPSVPLMVMVMFSVAMVPLHRDRFYPGRLTAQVNRVTVRTASAYRRSGLPLLFTELPRRVLSETGLPVSVILGNWVSDKRASRKLSFDLCSTVRTAQFEDYTGLSIRTMEIVWLARRRVPRCIKNHRF